MYTKITQEDDNNMNERCQKEMDGILVFSGLFSATVGALLTISLQDLKPNSQDTSVFYLKNIYLQLGSLNASIPSSLADPPPFSPPSYVIWVNSLWFLSLVISLTGATSATILQQWAQRYITVTQQPWQPPDKRARIRAVFAHHPWGRYVNWGGARSAFYLHLSLFLFFAGCLIYLHNVNHTVFKAVVSWLVFYTTIYATITLSSTINPEELLFTPFSAIFFRLYVFVAYLVIRILSIIKPLRGVFDDARKHYRLMIHRYSEGFLQGTSKAVEETALKPSSEIDALVLERLLLALDEDDSLEKFFDAIPGFCTSKLVTVPFSSSVQTKFQQALDGFLDRTFSSDSTSESVRSIRLVICLNAAEAAIGPDGTSRILDDIFNGRWSEALQSVEIGISLRRWGINRDDTIVLNVRRVVACIIARTRERDDRWSMLVKDEFGVPDRVLRDYISHGDNVLLAILLHTTREAFRAHRPQRDVLRSLSRLEIRDALPGLQHDFCALWNEVVQEAGNKESDGVPIDILVQIRPLYVTLHEGFGPPPTSFSPSIGGDESVNLFEPSIYPLCTIASHRPDRTIDTPLTATQLGDSLTIPFGRWPVPGGSAASLEASKANVIPALPSSTDIAEGILTVKALENTRDVKAPVPMERSCLPQASYVDTKIVLPGDEPTPRIHASDTGVTSTSSWSAPVTSSIAFPHSGLVPAGIVLPTTGPDLLSSSCDDDRPGSSQPKS
ncbi:hypothetical protein F5148DRAFT_236657 [Russula earlei]|uniref:Uncharacterized protein n=1 Tax=Russula earlei TaxID=71964 RepID=A0ACC0U5D7_9AGAM|nr:hypothetical protein F5148DRAFT_236657 [Russula earlei]